MQSPRHVLGSWIQGPAIRPVIDAPAMFVLTEQTCTSFLAFTNHSSSAVKPVIYNTFWQ